MSNGDYYSGSELQSNLGESYMGLYSVCEMGSTVLGVSWGAMWERVTWDYVVCVNCGVLFWE